MSDRKRHIPLETAEATRTRIINSVRRQAETVVEQLQRDVLRLIEEAHHDIEKPQVPEQPLPSEPPIAHPDGDEHRGRAHLDAELRQLITDLIRPEIAALGIEEMVKAEVDAQLRTVSKLLQERLQGMVKPNNTKLPPMLSRRRI